MIDFHSHILPQIDDGSRSIEESLAILHMLKEQGVATVVATPHFYPSEDHPDAFLARRANAWERLKEHLTSDMPSIRLGAEVAYYEGVSRSDFLDDLCIEGTRILLIEMPFEQWSNRIVHELIDLQEQRQITVVLAHFERYLHLLSDSTQELLLRQGFLVQCNAGFFLRWQTRGKAMRMLRNGQIHLLGSDSHGSKYRPPRMGEAMALIRRKGGDTPLQEIEARAELLLRQEILR